MPFVEIKLFEERVDNASAARLGVALTDAVCAVLGEQVRPSTWVVVSGVPAQRWTVAGSSASAPTPARDS